MRFKATMLIMISAAAYSTAAAQTPPATTRTVIAATKLPTMTDGPLNFRAVSIPIPPGAEQAVEAIATQELAEKTAAPGPAGLS